MMITDAVEPAWRYRDERVELAIAAMRRRRERSRRRPIRLPVTTSEGIGASFDNGITYYKGASVLRMFEAYVGPDKWRDESAATCARTRGGTRPPTTSCGDLRDSSARRPRPRCGRSSSSRACRSSRRSSTCSG